MDYKILDNSFDHMQNTYLDHISKIVLKIVMRGHMTLHGMTLYNNKI